MDVVSQKERDAFRAGARFGWEIGGEAWDGMRVEWQANHRYPEGDTNQDDNAQEAQDAKGAPSCLACYYHNDSQFEHTCKPALKEAKRWQCMACRHIFDDEVEARRHGKVFGFSVVELPEGGGGST